MTFKNKPGNFFKFNFKEEIRFDNFMDLSTINNFDKYIFDTDYKIYLDFTNSPEFSRQNEIDKKGLIKSPEISKDQFLSIHRNTELIEM